MPAKTKEVVGYIQAHVRVRNARGNAKGYLCIFCRVQQATDWAYGGTDPDALISKDKWSFGMPYSLDITRYVAACRSCHSKFDGRGSKNLAKMACPKGHPYAGSNLYVQPTGWRACRICLRAADQRYRLRKRASR